MAERIARRPTLNEYEDECHSWQFISIMKTPTVEIVGGMKRHSESKHFRSNKVDQNILLWKEHPRDERVGGNKHTHPRRARVGGNKYTHPRRARVGGKKHKQSPLWPWASMWALWWPCATMKLIRHGSYSVNLTVFGIKRTSQYIRIWNSLHQYHFHWKYTGTVYGNRHITFMGSIRG